MPAGRASCSPFTAPPLCISVQWGVHTAGGQEAKAPASHPALFIWGEGVRCNWTPPRTDLGLQNMALRYSWLGRYLGHLCRWEPQGAHNKDRWLVVQLPSEEGVRFVSKEGVQVWGGVDSSLTPSSFSHTNPL